jgi:hypothetical protein
MTTVSVVVSSLRNDDTAEKVRINRLSERNANIRVSARFIVAVCETDQFRH